MIKEQINETTVRLAAFNFTDLLIIVQEHAKEGYSLSLTNEHWPQGYLGHWQCYMTKEESSEVEKKTPQTRGRPKNT